MHNIQLAIVDLDYFVYTFVLPNEWETTQKRHKHNTPMASSPYLLS